MKTPVGIAFGPTGVKVTVTKIEKCFLDNNKIWECDIVSKHGV
jgi:hypothetical protein